MLLELAWQIFIFVCFCGVLFFIVRRWTHDCEQIDPNPAKKYAFNCVCVFLMTWGHMAELELP